MVTDDRVIRVVPKDPADPLAAGTVLEIYSAEDFNKVANVQWDDPSAGIEYVVPEELIEVRNDL
jgi:hypothetical protein